MTTALKSDIREFARASVREALAHEIAKIRASLLPLVSRAEQRDVEKRYKGPSRRAVRTIRVRI